MEPINIFNAFRELTGLDSKGLDRKEALIKNLKPEQRETLKKVLQIVNGKILEMPTEKEMYSLGKAFMEKMEKEAPITSALTKIGKGIQNIFGRLSSKQLMTEFNQALALQTALEALNIKSPTTQGAARQNFNFAVKAGNMRAHYYLAKMDFAEKKVESALEHLKRGAKGGDPFCQLELARNFIDEGKFKKGEKFLLQALKKLPYESKQDAIMLGHIYEDMGDFARAFKMYQAANSEKDIARMEELREELTEKALIEAGLMPPREAPVKEETLTETGATFQPETPVKEKARGVTFPPEVQEETLTEAGVIIFPSEAPVNEVLVEKYRSKELSDVYEEADDCVVQLKYLSDQATLVTPNDAEAKKIREKAAELVAVARSLPSIALHKVGESTSREDPKAKLVFDYAELAVQLGFEIQDKLTGSALDAAESEKLAELVEMQQLIFDCTKLSLPEIKANLQRLSQLAISRKETTDQLVKELSKTRDIKVKLSLMPTLQEHSEAAKDQSVAAQILSQGVQANPNLTPEQRLEISAEISKILKLLEETYSTSDTALEKAQ